MTMVMTAKTISASRFKAQCLAMLDDVAATGEELIVTKRGLPVARVLPAGTPAGLVGSVRFNVDDDAILEPVEVDWDATR